MEAGFRFIEEVAASKGLRVTIVHFNSLATVCRSAADMPALERCIRVMRSHGLQPDYVFYSVIISACEERLRGSGRDEQQRWLDVAEAAFEQLWAQLDAQQAATKRSATEELSNSGLGVFVALGRCYACLGNVTALQNLRKQLNTRGIHDFDALVALEAECQRHHMQFSSAWMPLDPTLPREYMNSKNDAPRPHPPVPKMAVQSDTSCRVKKEEEDVRKEDWFVLLSEGANINADLRKAAKVA